MRLLEKGVSIETVCVLLGHADPTITVKPYRPWVRSTRSSGFDSKVSFVSCGDDPLADDGLCPDGRMSIKSGRAPSERLTAARMLVAMSG